nr:response regulator transcription factor [Bradyrhizobium sp. KB893862 SZCCT0404]
MKRPCDIPRRVRCRDQHCPNIAGRAFTRRSFARACRSTPAFLPFIRQARCLKGNPRTNRTAGLRPGSVNVGACAPRESRTTRVRSLVIEDEPQIGAYVSRLLGQLHGVVDLVGSIADARQALDNFKYDLAIVDRMLPDGDALEVVTALSRSPDRPAIIMLTSKDATEDVVDGLNGGADDYLGKPFEPQELIARVRAVLRRPRLLAPSVLSLGNVELHLGSNEVVVADRKILLRRREALILGALLMRRDRVITRAALIEEIYGFDDEIESNTLEAQVSRLRKKLATFGGDVEIRSMRGIGYILRLATPR